MESLRTFILLFLTLLSGCAGMAQAPDLIAPRAGKAVVYIYRVDLSPADTDRMVPNVRVNDESIGPLTRRGYFRVEVDPGPAQVALYRLDRGYETFWPAAQDVIVNLELAPNSTHFVELSLSTATFSFRETSRDAALQALSGKFSLN